MESLCDAPFDRKRLASGHIGHAAFGASILPGW